MSKLTAVGIATFLGVALGYFGQRNINPEALPRNLIVLLIWVLLTTLIALLYSTSRHSPGAKALGLTLITFMFVVFASYRQKSGGLGDSKDYFLVATYNLNYGDPAGINLSYPISKFANQLLFDIGFSRIWIVPWILGVLFLLIVASGLVMTMKRPRLSGLDVPLLALIFSASSAVLYFFRTYMEVYTYGALALGAGLILASYGFKKRNRKLVFVSAALIGLTPLFHVLFGVFVLTIGGWGLLLILKLFQSSKLALTWIVGIAAPTALFLSYLLVSRPRTNLGSLGSLREPGSVNPAISDLHTWQIGLSLAFLSFPAVFVLLINYLLNPTLTKSPSSSELTVTPWLIGLLGALAIQWSLYVSVYWFLNGLDQDRDHFVVMTIPLACLLSQILPHINKRARGSVVATLCFSSAVTATIVTSFIEPTFDTGALVALFR